MSDFMLLSIAGLLLLPDKIPLEARQILLDFQRLISRGYLA